MKQINSSRFDQSQQDRNEIIARAIWAAMMVPVVVALFFMQHGSDPFGIHVAFKDSASMVFAIAAILIAFVATHGGNAVLDRLSPYKKRFHLLNGLRAT